MYALLLGLALSYTWLSINNEWLYRGYAPGVFKVWIREIGTKTHLYS